MVKELRTRHTTASDGKTVAVLHGLPEEGEKLSPSQMRTLARALLRAADACEGSPEFLDPQLNERSYSLIE